MLVRKSPRQALLILLAVTLTLAACNVGATPAPTTDVNAINTAALATAMAQISAQQTQTALAAPSVAPLPTDTPLSLTAFALPTSAVASPTGNAGVLPTVSFNTTPNTTPLAGFTQLATSLPPTSSGQASTASGCNDGALVGETLPDKSEVTAGKEFVKAWEMKNTGTCDWDEGFVFAFQPDLSSSGIEGYDIVLKTSDRVIKPNKSESFVIKLTAPTTAGEYKGYWKMKDDAGNYFGSLVFFDVIVK